MADAEPAVAAAAGEAAAAAAAPDGAGDGGAHAPPDPAGQAVAAAAAAAAAAGSVMQSLKDERTACRKRGQEIKKRLKVEAKRSKRLKESAKKLSVTDLLEVIRMKAEAD